jgi:hypothetical protein
MPNKIDDLDDAVHDLIPHLAIQIDFLKQQPNSSKPALPIKRKKERKPRTPLILMICTKMPATAPK